MPNLRVVYDNAAKRATLSAATQAGLLSVDNLKNNLKHKIYRSVGRTATLTAVFSSLEPVSCVALPFCNLTSTSTIRVRIYTNSGDANPVLDTGVKPACAYAPLGLWDWGTQPLGVNAFSYGGVVPYGVVWFSATSGRKVLIDISDTDNPSAYIEAAFLIIGNYWSPRLNASYGAAIAALETSKHERNQAGNLRSDRGTISRKLTVDLKDMQATDRSQFWNIMIGNGMTNPVFFSLTPESDDTVGEQMYQIYGKLSQQSRIALQAFDASQAPLELDEV